MQRFPSFFMALHVQDFFAEPFATEPFAAEPFGFGVPIDAPTPDILNLINIFFLSYFLLM